MLLIFMPELSDLHIFFSNRWIGSNNNPKNNDGMGRDGTDRHNMVILRSRDFPKGTQGKYEKWTAYRTLIR